ncbi:hypothetical protein GKIL_3257 [Gloeobacter kilaueensis JS1]|uniref:Uncharacterized protein n=2 Tax=Gloeobacter TaxID=33071 RepID=U5QKV7_GLOK1|nr:hypothetical protein GKIL_3257 [Gloeobacter kilaueensis JS1]
MWDDGGMAGRQIWAVILFCATGLGRATAVWAEEPVGYELPPPEDTPEEVLRLEEPGYATSPVDGERLSLGDYARLQAELQDAQYVQPKINPKLANLIFLLKLRKLLRVFLPFL